PPQYRDWDQQPAPAPGYGQDARSADHPGYPPPPYDPHDPDHGTYDYRSQQ
ncbi:hypothetical protein H3146_16920, partial [Streptomyces sp. OF3]|nr:hypothetical protein [Streptomyces alkaliterrae]